LTLIFAASVLGGGINAIAGGGTLLTFPSLIGIGVPPIVANATSTVALWPGALSSMWGYRDTLRGTGRWVVQLALPSIVGGLAGALLLLHTDPERFNRIVPWLVLGATALFLLQRPLVRWIWRAPAASGTGTEDDGAQLPSLILIGYQLLVSVYGGYFGAGVGILNLAALGFMGFTNIHRMNGLKNWCGVCINAVAAVTFIASGVVNWPVAATMAIGSIAGGYATSRIAQRVPQTWVRQAIVLIGLASGIWLLAR
jgi:uncharacterized membrane protein YfcA